MIDGGWLAFPAVALVFWGAGGRDPYVHRGMRLRLAPMLIAALGCAFPWAAGSPGFASVPFLGAALSLILIEYGRKRQPEGA
jgi:hypothetical protein